jgi:stage II sporulation protein D
VSGLVFATRPHGPVARGAWRAVVLVGGLLALLGASSPADALGLIRVAVVEQARTVEIRGTDMEVVPAPLPARAGEPSTCARCGRSWRASILRASVVDGSIVVEGRRATVFRVRSDGPIRVAGRDYPAVIELVRHGEGLAVVNELPLEDYLAGVLRAESNERWPLEALKAQAVASRTYAAYQRSIAGERPFHILASVAHQMYAGRVGPESPAWTAVRATAGQVLHWEGELFPAFYHTESGGWTEDPRTVFATRNMPGLKAVRCEFSAGSPHYYWQFDLRLADLSEILRRHEVGVGAVTAIDVAERTPSLRAVSLLVRGTQGTVRVRGNELRRMVGYDTLKSTLFAVAVDGEFARFSGRGYGHGVGLCQWGAKGMAEQGYTARQILEFYYQGTTPARLAP